LSTERAAECRRAVGCTPRKTLLQRDVQACSVTIRCGAEEVRLGRYETTLLGGLAGAYELRTGDKCRGAAAIEGAAGGRSVSTPRVGADSRRRRADAETYWMA